MERKLRTTAKRVQDETKLRNWLICTAVAEGASLREVAAAVGLDHTGVRKIVLKGPPKL